MGKDMGNLNFRRGIETLKVNKKSTKLETAEEKIHELEDRSIEITQNEAQREKRLEKHIRASMTYGIILHN